MSKRLALLVSILLLAGCGTRDKPQEPQKQKPAMELMKSQNEQLDLWTTNFEAAKAKAKKENKFLLVNFTGSDWCGWCKKLKAEVFDQEEFMTEAPKQFVLVELDYPHSKKLPAELELQNNELQEKYKVSAFPTILLLDTEGHVVARTGYSEGGPEKYVAQLDVSVGLYKSILELKPKLATVQGLERAQLLDQIIELYTKLQIEAEETAGWSKDIIALDPDNKAGLKLKYEISTLIATANKLRQAKQFSEAKESLDKVITLAGITPEQKQSTYISKANCDLATKNYSGVVENLKKAIDAAPTSSQALKITKMLKTYVPKAEAQEAQAKIYDELEKAEGLDRAKVLDRLIEARRSLVGVVGGIPAVNPGGILGHQIIMGSVFDDEDIENIEKWCKEIVALDADNKASLKRKYEYRSLIAEAEVIFREKDYEKVLKTLDNALALPDLSVEEEQGLLFLKSDVNIMLKDLPTSLDYCTKALAVSSDSPLVPLLKDRVKRLEMIREALKAKQAEPNESEKKPETPG